MTTYFIHSKRETEFGRGLQQLLTSVAAYVHALRAMGKEKEYKVASPCSPQSFRADVTVLR